MTTTVLHLDQAEYNANTHMAQWYWPHFDLNFISMGQESWLVNDAQILWHAYGLYTPLQVWSLLMVALLDYGVVCQPLIQDHYLSLP